MQVIILKRVQLQVLSAFIGVGWEQRQAGVRLVAVAFSYHSMGPLGRNIITLLPIVHPSHWLSCLGVLLDLLRSEHFASAEKLPCQTPLSDTTPVFVQP